MWRIGLNKTADEDLAMLRKGSKNDYIKFLDLLRDILKDPRTGIGRPERLRYQDEGEEVWSRRINEKDRLVYAIFEETNTILIPVSTREL